MPTSRPRPSTTGPPDDLGDERRVERIAGRPAARGSSATVPAVPIDAHGKRAMAPAPVRVRRRPSERRSCPRSGAPAGADGQRGEARDARRDLHDGEVVARRAGDDAAVQDAERRSRA